MNTKLTLKLESEIIEQAKEYARKNKTSLSRIVESYLRSITGTSGKSGDITPLVENLSGVIKLDTDDYKREYTDFLSEKYK